MFSNRRFLRVLVGVALFVAAFSARVSAQEIDGVQPAAIDQPRINVAIRRTIHGDPLITNADGQASFNVEAFLDTGAGSVLIATNTAASLGVTREPATANPPEARFEDVGVGGESQFAISEPLFLSMAPCTPNAAIDDKATLDMVYNQSAGPFRSEIGPLGAASGLLSLLTGDLDVAGMPAMQGKIVVMDNTDVNKFEDKIRTYIYDAKSIATASPPIPKTTRHVQLSYASFARFTTTTPANAQGPAISANPFIGPNPLKPAGDRATSLVLMHAGKRSLGSWLLDTGAVASMISRSQAQALGVTYKPGTYGTDSPELIGPGTDKQFTLAVGGIGGAAKSAGFYIDRLVLPTREGTPIVFLRAPMLVADITVKDSTSGQSFTLDGVFGMNFLVASAKIEGGLLPDITAMSPGAFRWIVFDQPEGILGFD
jgi:hypothetical protein